MRKKVKIIIVEDNDEFLLTLATYISSQEDMKVIATARNGMEAIEKIVKLNPDIVLLDVLMPKLNGLDVLEKINEKLDNIPICIMMSAVGQEEVIGKAMRSGAQYYMIKPFDIKVLMQRIRELLEKKESKMS